MFAIIIFSIAIIHSFLVSPIEKLGHQFKPDSFLRKFFHFMSEVELIFGFWAFILFLYFAKNENFPKAYLYLKNLDMKESLFVSVIMLLSATKGIIYFSERLILFFAKILPLHFKLSFYLMALIIGPLMGSIITEPAAMVLTTLVLLDAIFEEPNHSKSFLYATLSLMLVNVSIGGVMTNFTSPPVVIAANYWKWNNAFMFHTFGVKALLAMVLSTVVYAIYFRKELKGKLHIEKSREKVPFAIILLHFIFVGVTVYFAHQVIALLIITLIFLLFYFLTRKYQDPLRWRSSIFVGIFLAGLMYLGSFQGEWINHLMAPLSGIVLNILSTLLTSITDNALITYLGTKANLSESSRYFLVAGAVTGGGLTVIANAPNPIAINILRKYFGAEGINPLKIFLWSLIPTIITGLCFIILA